MPQGCQRLAPQSLASPLTPKRARPMRTPLRGSQEGATLEAVDSFRKANKQDSGHCSECLNRAYTLASSIGDYKDAADIARDWMPVEQTDAETPALHYPYDAALQEEGIESKKDKC